MNDTWILNDLNTLPRRRPISNRAAVLWLALAIASAFALGWFSAVLFTL